MTWQESSVAEAAEADNDTTWQESYVAEAAEADDLTGDICSRIRRME